MNAIIFGATGLVGGHLLDQLSSKNYYEEIYIVTRRNNFQNSNENIHHLSFEEFNSLNNLKIDHYYCSLGTTIKKAGSKENFYEIDHDLVINTLRKSKELGTTKHSIVSALGAKSDSMVYYNKVKGEMEKSAKSLDPKAIIVRPSLIDGERNETRFLEHAGLLAMTALNKVLIGPLRKYQSIHAKEIAKAMYELLTSGETKVHIEYEA